MLWAHGANALPHLHLHAQAVEEMTSEGQAVHWGERGINPAWERETGTQLVSTPQDIPQKAFCGAAPSQTPWGKGPCQRCSGLFGPDPHHTDGEAKAWELADELSTPEDDAQTQRMDPVPMLTCTHKAEGARLGPGHSYTQITVITEKLGREEGQNPGSH